MRVVCLCVLVVSLGMADLAFGQSSVNGSIRGYVRDEQGAVLPAVMITAGSPNSATTSTATTDGDGYYRLLDLPPGPYTLTAELTGFAKFVRENIVVRAGLSLGVEIALKIGQLDETVVVNADTPMLETRSAGQAVNISGDFQRQVPILGTRHWSDFLELTPGIITNRNVADQNFAFRGSNLDAHVMQLDGADVSSGQQGGNFYIKFSPEIIEDTKVQLSGIDASAPLGFGAIINVATRSGTNRFSGSISSTYQAEAWNDNNVPDGTSATAQVLNTDIAAGGPIRRDRAWWYGAYRYTNRRDSVARTPQQLATLQAVAPGFEPFDTETTGHFPFIKGTVQISPHHQLYGFYQRDDTPRGSASPLDTRPFPLSVIGGWAASSRLSSVWSDRFTTRLNAGFTDKASSDKLEAMDLPNRNLHASIFSSGGRLMGTGAVAYIDNSDLNRYSISEPKLTVSLDAIYYRPGWLGSHDFQSGVYLQTIRDENIVDYVNGGASVEDLVLRDPSNPAAGMVPFHRQVYDQPSLTDALRRRWDIAFYGQDEWQITPRLTINAGLRVDFIRQRDLLFGVQTQRSIDLGPRVGANYLLTSDGRNSVFGSWVRVPAETTRTAFSVGTSIAGYTDYYDNDLDGTFETSFVQPASTALSQNQQIDPDFHQPFVNEWTVGYRRQFPGQMSVEIATARREYRDRRASIDVNPIYDNGVFVGLHDESQNAVNLITNDTYNWPVYSDIELTFSKQTSRVQVIGTYTRQFRHLEGTWEPNDPAAFIQPDSFPNDKGVGASHHSDSNGLTGSAMTGRPQWRDHAFKVGGAYQAPGNLLLAVLYSYQSGPWSGPIVTRIAAPDPRFGPATLTLSNGRRVSNPLATTIRYAYPTRGEGQFALDGMHILNLRIGREFQLGPRRLQLSFDLFNLLNGRSFGFVRSGANQMYNPVFGEGDGRQAPRSGQVMARFTF